MRTDDFSSLVDAHYAPLYRFALSLAHREAEACDLVQETFFIWARRGHQLRESAKAKTWLFTTLYREFLRSRRREQRQQSLEELPAAEQEQADEVVDHARRMDAADVVESLREVDEVFRSPLTLFYLEDLSYQEIADVLEIPIGTVMSRLSRGKNQLRAAVTRRKESRRVVPFPPLKKGAES